MLKYPFLKGYLVAFKENTQKQYTHSLQYQDVL